MKNYSEMTDAQIEEEVCVQMCWKYDSSRIVPWIRSDGILFAHTPEYVTSIDAAWEMIDEMRNSGKDEKAIEIYIYAGYEGFKVNVLYSNWNGEDLNELTAIAAIDAPTAPRAICEAWLVWKDATSRSPEPGWLIKEQK